MPRFSATQARLIDNQVTDMLANKAGTRMINNAYTKPMLYSTLGLGLGGSMLGASSKASLFGPQGLLPSITKAISPETYNMATAAAASKGIALHKASGGVLSNLASAYMPFRAALSAPGYAMSKGLLGLGSKMGAGSMLGGALKGAGAIIGGGTMAPILGSMATLYALRKGGQMLARSRAASGAARRMAMLQHGLAPSVSSGLSKGYTPDMVRQLGLQYIR